MVITEEVFKVVVNLRREGFSYREITKKTGASSSDITAIIYANEALDKERKEIDKEKEK